MKVLKAKKSNLEDSLKIAKKLKEWFTKEAIKTMQKDFANQNLLVAVEKKEVIGFLCFSKEKNYFQILWLGVKKSFQKKGVGTALFKKLEEITRKSKNKLIRTETLTESENYGPYELTRIFYSKKGFKKIATKQPEKQGWDIQDVLEKKIK